MTDASITEDVERCYESLALEEEIRKTAWRMYKINPTHAIGSLLSTTNWIMKNYGVDCTKDFGAIAIKVDEHTGVKE